jgi:chemotaxis protein histidine kinase CheA
MKATLSRAAEEWMAVPVRFGCPPWNKLPILLLLGLLLPAGCKDRGAQKARQDATDARATATKFELMLKGARDEISALKAELKAVRQTRDELQEQADKIKQDRDQALALSQQAKEVITNLAAKADGQAGATAGLEKQIADLKAVVQEQQKLIEELQKGVTAQPPDGEPSAEAVKDKTPPPAEPNEKP